MPAVTDDALATALAGAFLAGPWTPTGLVAGATQVLGGPRRGQVSIVAEVLRYYRDPPRDRPRELAALIAGCPAFARTTARARKAGHPLHPHVVPVEATRMARMPWPVRPLDDVGALADLLGLTVGRLEWHADTAGRQRRAPAGGLHLYDHRWLARPGRTPRLIEIPRPRLRLAQRRILDEIVYRIPTHPAAHGFVPGRSVRTGAAVHTGAEVVIGLDLVAFFASVAAGRVYGIFRTAGYPEATAYLLTGLCTTATPVPVLAAMPAGGSGVERFALRRRLAAPHLPQGAPNAPALANLCTYRLDCRLTGYAESVGAAYTRYADDLTLSGGPGVRRRADAVVRAVTGICGAEGFAVAPAKTRVAPRGHRQQVTGIVVNSGLNVTRREYDVLKAILHNAARTSPAAQNRAGHPDFRAHLLGRIAWVGSLHPERGRRLRAAMSEITW